MRQPQVCYKGQELDILQSMNATATIRLLAVDLDDTLLREDLTVSEENRQALLEAEDAGVTVLLASGRVMEAMKKYAQLLGMTERPGYLISNNGCTISESHTGEIIYRRWIESEVAAAVYRAAKEEGFPVEVYRGDTICTDQDNKWTDLDSMLSGLKKRVLPDFEESLLREAPVKMVITGEPEEIALFEPRLKKLFGEKSTIFISKPFFLEVLPPDTDKGIALAHLAQLLAVPRESVMAIGDSYNDLGMIQWAGVGVAMINGIEAAKAVARYTTLHDNEHHGVAEAVHQFLFQE
jgi:Cof subfamily protein (haloacid dehalogenase superfamily)